MYEDRRRSGNAELIDHASWSDRRDLHRAIVTLPARTSSMTLGGLKGLVKDISTRGCRFSMGGLPLGEVLTIRIGSVGPINATVAWSDENGSGLRFREPLHRAVVEHLSKTR